MNILNTIDPVSVVKDVPVSDVVDAVENVVGEVPEVVNAVENVPEVVDTVENVVEEVPEVVNAVENVVGKVPEVVDTVENVVGEVPEVVNAVANVVGNVPEVVDTVGNVVENVAGEVPKVLDEVVDVGNDVAGDVLDNVQQPLKDVSKVAQEVLNLNNLVDSAKDVLNPGGLTEALDKVPDQLNDVSGAVNKVVDATNLVDSDILNTGDLTNVVGSIPEVLGGAAGAVGDAVDSVGETVGDVVNMDGLAEGVDLPKVLNDVSDIAGNVFGDTAETVNDLLTKLPETNVLDAVGDLTGVEAVKNVLDPGKLSSVIAAAPGTVGDVTKVASDVVGDTVETLGNVLKPDTLTNVVGDIPETINKITNPAEILETVNNVLNPNGLSDVLSSVPESVKDVASNLVDTVPKVVDGAMGLAGEAPEVLNNAVETILNPGTEEKSLRRNILKSVPKMVKGAGKLVGKAFKSIPRLFGFKKDKNNLDSGKATNLDSILDTDLAENIVTNLASGILPKTEDLLKVLQQIDLNGLTPEQLLSTFPLENFQDMYKELLTNELLKNVDNLIPFVDPFKVVDNVLGKVLTYDSVGVIDEGQDESTSTQKDSEPSIEEEMTEEEMTEEEMTEEEREKKYYEKTFDTIPREYPQREIDDSAIVLNYKSAVFILSDKTLPSASAAASYCRRQYDARAVRLFSWQNLRVISDWLLELQLEDSFWGGVKTNKDLKEELENADLNRGWKGTNCAVIEYLPMARQYGLVSNTCTYPAKRVICEIPADFCARKVENRIDCGYFDIDKRSCNKRGCCFDNSKDNAPPCFYKKGDKRCAVPIDSRRPCGSDNMNQKDCITEGCCFDVQAAGQQKCFYPELIHKTDYFGERVHPQLRRPPHFKQYQNNP